MKPHDSRSQSQLQGSGLGVESSLGSGLSAQTPVFRGAWELGLYGKRRRH